MVLETDQTSYRAAQYVRMSTEHQQYSTNNQADKILEYAQRRNIEIVRTYADEGKSGLSLGGRASLQKLLSDVEAGLADFSLVLVYDVSRWGRFQDADEAAYYEYKLRRKGIQVAYVAEQFENDGSPVSTIVKGVKRAMAGEYSRELSAKVFAGQCRLIELGFRQGGPAGFGLRRVLLDQSGAIKTELSRGEQKSLQTDRVILVPGTDAEVARVNQIFQWLIVDDLAITAIANRLNAAAVLTDLERPWTYSTVRQVLSNEKSFATLSVAAQVAVLPSLPTPELWALWDRHFPRRPENPNRNYLESRVAYKIQEQALGGLPAETQRRLINIGMRHSKIKGRLKSNAIELAPGTILFREWGERDHKVTVTADGSFEYEGKFFKSLSAVARHISGTPWSGPLFFGLKSKTREAA